MESTMPAVDEDIEQSTLQAAAARRAEGDAKGEEVALNQLLEIEPDSVLGHVLKGDCRVRAGDSDTACYLYRRALRLAEGKMLPDEAAAEVGRARLALADLEGRAHSAREARLNSRGIPEEQWSPRFRQSLEIAAGRRKLYLQDPTAFAYSGLPHIQFYEPGEFGWAPSIESAAPAIREELAELLKQGTDQFNPYLQTDVGAVRLGENKSLVQSRDWSALHLCHNGWLAPELIERCPRTWETVLKAPVPRVSGWGPTVMFSLLKAGARIAPHTGMFNTRLVCHLPLIVPPGCRFRVGNEVREWQEGKLLIFDDTIEHEAWNDSAEDRIILIFDIWRPELSDQEKHELTALFSD
jgi:aspartyl/asparaginyl beta-hydroxylase (cupin superfamily)